MKSGFDLAAMNAWLGWERLRKKHGETARTSEENVSDDFELFTCYNLKTYASLKHPTVPVGSPAPRNQHPDVQTPL